MFPYRFGMEEGQTQEPSGHCGRASVLLPSTSSSSNWAQIFICFEKAENMCSIFGTHWKLSRSPFKFRHSWHQTCCTTSSVCPLHLHSQISLNTEKRAHGTSRCLTENKQVLYIQAKRNSSDSDEGYLSEFSQRWWWWWWGGDSHCLMSTLTHDSSSSFPLSFLLS